MSAKILGAPIWSALSTTATRSVAVAAVAVLTPGIALAGGGVERLVGDVRSVANREVPTAADVTRQCADDVECAARMMVAAIGPRARLEPVRHPTTDQIRWVTTTRSVTRVDVSDQGVLTLRLERFGRKVVAELRSSLIDAARTGPPVRAVTVDLRTNHGGDFDRMLRAASLFIGHVPDAVRLTGKHGATTRSVPPGEPLLRGLPLRVEVSRDTASSAEVLTALLKIHGGAVIVGSRTFGKNYLLRVVPVSHDTRLLVPAETVEVPGIDLVGGLVPDVAADAE